MRDIQKGLLIVGGVLIAIGLGLGFFRPVHDHQGVKCGTAFGGADEVAQLTATFGSNSVLPACDEPLSDAKTLPFILIGAGLVSGFSIAAFQRSGESRTG